MIDAFEVALTEFAGGLIEWSAEAGKRAAGTSD